MEEPSPSFVLLTNSTGKKVFSQIDSVCESDGGKEMVKYMK
jgi:hypothetical protein